MPLGKAQVVEKIQVAVPGMLDSMHFDTDGLAAMALRIGEVEIEVEATGIK